MHTLECPFEGCSSTTEHESEVLAIALFNAHISTHTVANTHNGQRTGASKSEKIVRPKGNTGGRLELVPNPMEDIQVQRSFVRRRG